MRLVLIGPPGCGKGTLSSFIVKEYGTPHISTGDIFREHRASGSSFGQKIASYIDRGELVPDELVLDVVFDRLGRPDCAKGFIFDGFPRTLQQAEAAWRQMIEAALEQRIPVILLTPSWDRTWFAQNDEWHALEQHAEQIRRLAGEYGTALADSFAAYEKEVREHGDLLNLLSHWNHPSPLGHELIARELTAWFPAG